MAKKIKISSDNEGRALKIKGNDHVVDKVLANKEKFRIKQGAGETVLDYSFDDIDKVKGLIIDIT